jgi:MATE family multidrug resistance protein
MIGKMGNSDIPIATLSAIISTTQVWTGGLVSGFIAVAGIRVGRFMGQAGIRNAKQAARVVMCCSLGTSLVIAPLFMGLARQFLMMTTDDEAILRLGEFVMVPYVLSCVCTSFVTINTSGVFAGQGRASMETILAFGFELPLTIGTCALFVFYFQLDLLALNWALCAIFGFEALVVLVIYATSNWERYVDATLKRQDQ